MRSIDGYRARIRNAVKGRRRVVLKTHAYLPRTRDYIDAVLYEYLDLHGMGYLKDKISYCLHELATNAKKANTKRVYFQEQGLDIFSRVDYDSGLANFKKATLDNIDHYLRRQKELDLYLKIQFEAGDQRLQILIRNNVLLTPQEEARINQKIENAKRFETLAEAYASIEDSTEGAGLGIVMMILMLDGLGFGKNVFSMRTGNGETVASIDLDLSKNKLEQIAGLDGLSAKGFLATVVL